MWNVEGGMRNDKAQEISRKEVIGLPLATEGTQEGVRRKEK